MDVQKSAERFESALATLPEAIGQVLMKIPLAVKAKTFEIRLRTGRPISIISGSRCWFVDGKSQLHNIPGQCFSLSSEELQQAVIHMCNFSVHSHQQELTNGFISLQGGHRAGVCGTAVLKNGELTAIRDVTSVNLRIAREIHGVATPLLEKVFNKGIQGTLIVGVPSSGKTTLLRDLARQLSNGVIGAPIKVAVIDERGELGAVYEGVPQNDLGACCDILTGYPKGVGIMTAVRTLSPQIIICDEIGGGPEVESILDSINCGVKIVATAHASSMEELLARRQICRLIENGAFDKIVQLGDARTPGYIEKVLDVEGLSVETDGCSSCYSMLHNDGDVHGIRPVPAGCQN